MLSRVNIRQTFRAQRLALTVNEIQIASSQLKQQLLRNLNLSDAKHIAAYLAYHNEIDPLPWLQEIYHKINCYLPVINPSLKTMLFARFKSDTLLKNNQYGILEPAADDQILLTPHELDIVLLPLIAFDLHGNRLGSGAGYYDKTFAFLNEKNIIKKPKLIGLAYEFQKIDEIPSESWDVPLDVVITEKNFYRF